jgi:hypothetical protein
MLSRAVAFASAGMRGLAARPHPEAPAPGP